MAKLVRFGKQMNEAILMVLKYVTDTTGNEPTQKEIANAIGSYFILNEIGNQIKFQRKKSIPQENKPKFSEGPFWRLNLITGPPRNSLIRVGLFYEDIQSAIESARNFVKKSSGDEPSEEDIALSLKCTFILSEIKNQILWQRKSSQKNKEGTSNPR